MAKDKPEYLDIDTLREAGRLLYGDRWMTQMARALEVNERTVQRWDAENFNTPATVEPVLATLLRERMSEIKRFLAQR